VMSAGFHEEEQLGKAYDSRLMKRLMKFVKPYRLVVALSVVALLINSFFQIYVGFLTKEGIDDHILTSDYEGFRMVIIKYLIVVAIVFGTSFVQIYWTAWLGQKVQHDIRMRVFRHIQRLHLGYFDRNPVGRLVTRVTNDINTLNELFSSGVVAVLGDIFMLLLIVSSLLYLNWQLALITFVTLPILIWVTLVFRERARDAYRLVRLKLARLNSFVQEHITGINLVQLFTREKKTFENFDKINDDLKLQHHRSVLYYAIFYPTIEIIGALSVALLLYYGGVRVTESLLTFGELVAFMYLVEMFWRPIRDLSEKYNILQASMASSERIFDLLDTPPAITEIEKPRSIANFQGKLEIENLWFAYNRDDWVLKDVSFTVEPGEKVAIVGATGAGKTSLVSLLYRFYDYQKGSIKLDSIPIPELRLNKLRGHLGLVMQDVFLFEGDIVGNVRLRDQEISEKRVYEALERVGYDRFLIDSEQGIHTKIRERGATLSTGQKQLLSFARALAFDPDILMLDEATSSVDTETEQLIQRALNELLKERTSIIVAHRLSTIEKADKILVFHHGELRESGKHNELLDQNGIYSRLYKLQFKNQKMTEKATVTK
ncbi:MAG: ABC transporter ATP-binding protein, partial [bacterium]|nr:ABC transporter ATP-binding protein [bacterium]